MTEFEQIYQQYFHDVFLYIKALSFDDNIAEEITNETFFKALHSLHTFKGNCDVRVWLCQIAKNTYFTYCKKQKRFVSEEGLELLEDESVSVEEKTINKESSHIIHEILHSLKEPYKEVFTLRVFAELSFAQIGKIFNKNENWACVTFHRAKKKIKDAMEDLHE